MKTDTSVNETLLSQFRVVRGRNDMLISSNGREYLDLMTGFGAVLLGHSNKAILERVHQQVDEIWLTGRVSLPVVEEAARLVVSGLEQPYKLEQFYSSGNEAVEFAIRVATRSTHRKALVGFNRSMHGKSITASAMCWQNEFVDLRNVFSLPFVDACPEEEILDRLHQMLSPRNVAAVFLELIQGTNGAREASPEFYRTVSALCREHGTLCVVDEVLSGFYRSGSLSYSQEMGLIPDILIFGKAMANGFPISAVLCREGIEVTRSMHPGGTFSGNPLAASAVVATLCEMKRLDIRKLVRNVERTIQSDLEGLAEQGITLRGKGALFILELPDQKSAIEVQAKAFASSLVVTANENYVRLLPPATITQENLHKALDIIRKACLEI